MPIFWALAYILIVGVGIFLLRTDWGYDDPFITFRYARNLSQGIGFVYNPGEQILSTTTPLFTLILAAASLFVSNIPKAANLIGALSIAIGALLIFDIAASLKNPLVGWTGLVLYPLSVLLLDTLGSETPLYIAFCLASFCCYFRGRLTMAAGFSALAVLTRPDGILVAVILLADWLIIRRRPVPWKALLVFALILLPWVVFSWLYFGSPIPITLAAKQNQAFMAIGRKFPEHIFAALKQSSIPWYSWVLALLALAGGFYVPLRARQWAVFLAWPLLYFISYTALGVSSYFWYYAPLLPGVLVLVGLGLTSLTRGIEALFDHEVQGPTWRDFIPEGIGAAILLALLVPMAVQAVSSSRKNDSRYPIYRRAGIWLNKNTPLDASVGVLEVGMIGYFSDRFIVDFAGLIQPEIIENMDRQSTYSDLALLASTLYRPDYLVVNEGWLPEFETKYIYKNCVHVKQFRGSQYSYPTNLDIFSCSQP